MTWWAWLLVAWVAVSVLIAVPFGVTLREADRRERGLPSMLRRRIPVPPLAVVLAGLGVTLEALGFLLRAAGADRTGTGHALSMDAPLSVPRMYVTALFALAALAAFTGAARNPGRRSWWLAVGLVAAVIAEVKGGGTVHVRAVHALGLSGHPVQAAVVSGAIVVAVLAVLGFLSRNDRRDRRRTLIAFAVYGAASGGLSSVSSGVGQATGSAFLTALATFVEESGEAVGAVTVLVAVLVGVAPRLVLPAAWALRRTADAETIDAPGQLPVWAPDPRDLRG
jgi:hypothetical protein